jgi:hypothetical protein
MLSGLASAALARASDVKLKLGSRLTIKLLSRDVRLLQLAPLSLRLALACFFARFPPITGISWIERRFGGSPHVILEIVLRGPLVRLGVVEHPPQPPTTQAAL